MSEATKKIAGSALMLGGMGMGAVAAYADAAVEDWAITVKGDVAQGYTATIGQILEEEEARAMVMGCNCTGNPADGNAAVNAEVTGVSVGALISKAQPMDGANTVVFASADGYEVALPLSYVYNRYAPLVFDVNGSPLIDSVGGVNQLWMGSTSAKYFARDIVSITLEARQTPPPVPGTEEAEGSFGNLPNVGVYFGGEVE